MRRSLVVALFAVLALGVSTTSASAAATPCWRQVVNDWFKNGHVDGHYPIHCYSEALANLPEDSKQYSSAPEDIRRDMLLAIRGDAPGGSNGPGNGGVAPTGFGGVGLSASGQTRSKGGSGVFGGLFDAFGPKNASSVPLPLIVLAAVALLLLAAGGVSFAARRIQARKVQPPKP